jgi:hypothetical protein
MTVMKGIEFQIMIPSLFHPCARALSICQLHALLLFMSHNGGRRHRVMRVSA